jgi:hypothetical protein
MDYKIIERLDVLKNYADDHLDTWPKWKRDIVLVKIECLQRIMEASGRRSSDLL